MACNRGEIGVAETTRQERRTDYGRPMRELERKGCHFASGLRSPHSQAVRLGMVVPSGESLTGRESSARPDTSHVDTWAQSDRRSFGFGGWACVPDFLRTTLDFCENPAWKFPTTSPREGEDPATRVMIQMAYCPCRPLRSLSMRLVAVMPNACRGAIRRWQSQWKPVNAAFGLSPRRERSVCWFRPAHDANTSLDLRGGRQAGFWGMAFAGSPQVTCAPNFREKLLRRSGFCAFTSSSWAERPEVAGLCSRILCTVLTGVRSWQAWRFCDPFPGGISTSRR